jgi:hypothetical protein
MIERIAGVCIITTALNTIIVDYSRQAKENTTLDMYGRRRGNTFHHRVYCTIIQRPFAHISIPSIPPNPKANPS